MGINVESIEQEIKSKQQKIVRQEEKIARIKSKYDKQDRKARSHRLILRGVALENAITKVIGSREMAEKLGNEHIESVLETAMLNNEVQKKLERFAHEL